jgi:glycosyltransferase involved in cell wall biosynthesis/2-polyprenyl-3-methyl-5-hydroxy-6-metoxy-1,4-benzoquinol methylase
VNTPLSFCFLIDSVPFTPDVIAGKTSLGGSESACLGLARALKARGHDIDIFTTQLAKDAVGPDASGIRWHPMDDFASVNAFIHYDVCCALRLYPAFYRKINARLRMLWAQDLMVPGQMIEAVMGVSWALDHIAYVSQYHRDQWEDSEGNLAALGWVTRNGIDLSQVPSSSTRDPYRIIHISRPERGLGPILQMWPALKAREHRATLQVCRYSSMYDTGPGSWSDTCAQYDAWLKDVHEKVGGIEYLGELTKPELYKAISAAAVMWYPGVSEFAETSCIAAIEANACGTPFVGSYRGALIDTARPSYDAGLLIEGDGVKAMPALAHADVPDAYADASISAVLRMLDGCRSGSFQYRQLSKAGKAHAASYGYAQIAEEWEAQIHWWFQARYEQNKLRVLRALLHEDDHVAAREVARSMPFYTDDPVSQEVGRALDFCDHVIDGKEHDADTYAEFALPDPIDEAKGSERYHTVAEMYAGCTSLLDVACGNGSAAIAYAMANPNLRVHGVDFAARNIERARKAVEELGIADRCTFDVLTVYDFDRQTLHADCEAWLAAHAGQYDGMFVGEFIEHCANHQAIVDGLEAALTPGAVVVYTCPHGPFSELCPRDVPLRRAHVHHFQHDDLKAVFGPKQDTAVHYLDAGITERGSAIGTWVIRYTSQPGRRAGERPLWDRIVKTRPYERLSVGLIVKNAEQDLGKCLATVYHIADEIVVGDTGSADTTKAVAASWKARVLDLPPVMEHPYGFAGVRNDVLNACSGEWFLWIDADEHLFHPHVLRQYLDGAIFTGYVLHQTHLYLDGAPTFDQPCRLFRRQPDIQFYGCVHEQPQLGDCNGEINPSLELVDPIIVHLGYLSEEGREEKRITRNKPLLIRDQKVFPERLLGKVLLLREAVIESDKSVRLSGGMTRRAAQGYRHAINIFCRYFDDPAHKYTPLARPWYEAALKHLGIGWEVELALAGRAGGMQGARAKAERLWVRDADEYARVLNWRIAQDTKKMQPAQYKTLPFTVPVREAVTA